MALTLNVLSSIACQVCGHFNFGHCKLTNKVLATILLERFVQGLCCPPHRFCIARAIEMYDWDTTWHALKFAISFGLDSICTEIIKHDSLLAYVLDGVEVCGVP